MRVIYYHKLTEDGEVLSDDRMDKALEESMIKKPKEYYSGQNIVDLGKKKDDNLREKISLVKKLKKSVSFNLFGSDFNSRGKDILIISEKVIFYGNNSILYILMKSQETYFVVIQGKLIRYRVLQDGVVVSILELIDKNIYESVAQKIKRDEGDIPINFRDG